MPRGHSNNPRLPGPSYGFLTRAPHRQQPTPREIADTRYRMSRSRRLDNWKRAQKADR